MVTITAEGHEGPNVITTQAMLIVMSGFGEREEDGKGILYDTKDISVNTIHGNLSKILGDRHNCSVLLRKNGYELVDRWSWGGIFYDLGHEVTRSHDVVGTEKDDSLRSSEKPIIVQLQIIF